MFQAVNPLFVVWFYLFSYDSIKIVSFPTVLNFNRISTLRKWNLNTYWEYKMAAWEIERGKYFPNFCKPENLRKKIWWINSIFRKILFPGLHFFHIWIKRTREKKAIEYECLLLRLKMFITFWRLEWKKTPKIIQQTTIHQDGLDALSFWDCLLHLGKKRNLRKKRKKKVIKVILILFYFLIFSFINVRVLF